MNLHAALHGHTLYETPEAPSGGNEGGGNELYEPYLSDVPAEMHPLVLEPLRRQNADFTRKFQEAAQFRQRWEPYSKLGVHDVDPQELEGLLSLRQELSTDDGAKAWLARIAQEAPQLFGEEAWQTLGTANGWLSDEEQEGGFEDEDGPPQWFEEFRQQQEQRWSQFQGQQEMNQQLAQQEQAVTQRLEQVEQKYAAQFPQGIPDDIHDAAIDMAIGLVQTGQVQDQAEAIEPAFERIMKLRGMREGDEVEEKLAANGQTLNGGRPDTAPPKLSWNGGTSPKDAALARLKQQQ